MESVTEKDSVHQQLIAQIKKDQERLARHLRGEEPLMNLQDLRDERELEEISQGLDGLALAAQTFAARLAAISGRIKDHLRND
jgi:hypothetical protein